ncbi:peptide-methionine (S)-S-oxide reductase MsrA [soil metagenome]
MQTNLFSKIIIAAVSFLMIVILSCTNKESPSSSLRLMSTTSNEIQLDTATFGTGCFWCTEAIFQQLEGVKQVISGYSGGHVENPTYEQVCDKNTGHAECLNIVYDPTQISFDELLEAFWESHDPTTLNRQGNDVGPQYRSVVFYHNEQQKIKSEEYKNKLNGSGAWDNPVVTTIEPFTKFYPAENYHQNYYKNNNAQPYCYYVIRPKLEKFRKVFKGKLKPE